MFTDEDLPPAPRLKISKWLLSGLMAWSLFFGAIGGLAILMMGDAFFDVTHQEEAKRELVLDNDRVEAQVVAVDQRVTALERQTKQLKDIQVEIASEQQPDTQLAKILIGLTQLKTAYDTDTSLQAGIETLRHSVNDTGLQASLDELSALTQNNFPTKDKIISDLRKLNTTDKPVNNPRQNPELSWRDRAKQTVGQWVTVSDSSNVAKGHTVTRIEQAVAGGNYKLAQSYVRELPKTPAAESLASQINLRLKAQTIVQNIIGQIGRTLSQAKLQTEKGSLY